MIGAVPPRTTTELVGRREEIHRVVDALGWGDGGGGAVLLGGDAGIGKTALVGHVLGGAGGAAHARRALRGRGGHEPARTSPSSRCSPRSTPGSAGSSTSSSPTTPGLVPSSRGVAAGARGDAVRADLVEAVHGALADLGRRGPVLVVVEDVHWADESTRELLTLLFTRGCPDGVALLATYRSDDIHRRHPLAGALAVWSRLPGLSRVELGPLPDADLRRIVRHAGAALGEDVVDEVARRAEGNAFFAEELAAAAGDRGGRPRGPRPAPAHPGRPARRARPGGRPGRRRHRPAGAARRCSSAWPASTPSHAEGRAAGRRRAPRARAVGRPRLRVPPRPARRGGHRRPAPAERLQLHRACAEALREDPALGTSADLARHALASGDRPAPSRPRCSPATPPAGWVARPRRWPTTRRPCSPSPTPTLAPPTP